jgi:hypothetical protein
MLPGDELAFYAPVDDGSEASGWDRAASVRVLSNEVQDDDQQLQVSFKAVPRGARAGALCCEWAACAACRFGKGVVVCSEG